MKIAIYASEDSARVMANRCGEASGFTRDDKIARQVAKAITHALLPDTPKPMREADEPMPEVEVLQ